MAQVKVRAEKEKSLLSWKPKKEAYKKRTKECRRDKERAEDPLYANSSSF